MSVYIRDSTIINIMNNYVEINFNKGTLFQSSMIFLIQNRTINNVLIYVNRNNIT